MKNLKTGNSLRSFSMLPESFLEFLLGIIREKHEYFILTGTDPSLTDGCCPSKKVGYAEKLVRAGVLDSWKPDLPPGGCPSTCYAFSGEIQNENRQRPGFMFNTEFREKIQDILMKSLHTRALLRKIVLVVFLGLTGLILLLVVLDSLFSKVLV